MYQKNQEGYSWQKIIAAQIQTAQIQTAQIQTVQTTTDIHLTRMNKAKIQTRTQHLRTKMLQILRTETATRTEMHLRKQITTKKPKTEN